MPSPIEITPIYWFLEIEFEVFNSHGEICKLLSDNLIKLFEFCFYILDM